ncbi:hypothetical protein [Microcoleus sp. bin38.metabat.b11b12b14.051]|uniref:hypothetical protein n=1 Tax=Microcoleus sp. bin38.metabat.b11b12b14.051 TaxID=2742709 RepID=UPI0025E9A9F6|nr:hypothetical protein [Microcoleus sp. bin38.metabat.b11b12b14.051]
MVSPSMRKSQKPGFSQYFPTPNQKLVETRFLAPTVNLRNRVSLNISRHPTQKLVETRFLGPMRKPQKPGFSRYFPTPNQKLVETRFLAPTINLRNRVSLDIYRHPTKNSKKPGFSPRCGFSAAQLRLIFPGAPKFLSE